MDGLVSFRELLERARAGDADAIGELVRTYEPAIRRAVRLRMLDERLRRTCDSVDVCQSVLGSFFVRAALGEYELNTPDDLVRLLVSMARNKMADQTRKAQAACRDFRRIEAGEVVWAEVPGTSATPSAEVAYAELLREFNRRLTDEERVLAEQRRQGRAWVDLAVERGTTPDALRKQLNRAAERVAGELGLEVTDE
jgi:RNA polymerase sigma-70 factor (ECF subfamily)